MKVPVGAFNKEKVLIGAFSEYCEYRCANWTTLLAGDHSVATLQTGSNHIDMKHSSAPGMPRVHSPATSPGACGHVTRVPLHGPSVGLIRAIRSRDEYTRAQH